MEMVDCPRPSFTAQTANVRDWSARPLPSGALSPLTKTVGTPRLAAARAQSRNSETGLPFSVIMCVRVFSVWARLLPSEPARRHGGRSSRARRSFHPVPGSCCRDGPDHSRISVTSAGNMGGNQVTPAVVGILHPDFRGPGGARAIDGGDGLAGHHFAEFGQSAWPFSASSQWVMPATPSISTLI